MCVVGSGSMHNLVFAFHKCRLCQLLSVHSSINDAASKKQARQLHVQTKSVGVFCNCRTIVLVLPVIVHSAGHKVRNR